MMSTSRTFVATIVTLLTLATLLIIAPAGAAPIPAFPGDGCPSYNGSGAYTMTPDAEQLEQRNQEILGVGLAADGTDLTATVQVADMSKTVNPGFRWGYWQVFFSTGGGLRTLHAYYDHLHGTFSYWAFLGSTKPTRLEGSEKMGPGGGVSITIPLAALNLRRGDTITNVRAESGDFVSYVYMDTNNLTGTWPSGIYTQQWGKPAHSVFPILECPGVLLQARDRGNSAVTLSGYVLPQVSQDVVVERLVDGAWQPLVRLRSASTGGFAGSSPIPAGTSTLRAVVSTPSGVHEGAAVQVTITA